MNALYVFVPILILGLGVTGLISSTYLKMQRLKLEELRLKTGASADFGDLESRTAALEQELADVHERLDFAERMLSQSRDKASLPPGNPPA